MRRKQSRIDCWMVVRLRFLCWRAEANCGDYFWLLNDTHPWCSLPCWLVHQFVLSGCKLLSLASLWDRQSDNVWNVCVCVVRHSPAWLPLYKARSHFIFTLKGPSRPVQFAHSYRSKSIRSSHLPAHFYLGILSSSYPSSKSSSLCTPCRHEEGLKPLSAFGHP